MRSRGSSAGSLPEGVLHAGGEASRLSPHPRRGTAADSWRRAGSHMDFRLLWSGTGSHAGARARLVEPADAPLFSRVGERGMTGAERMTEIGKDALNIGRASAAKAPAMFGLFDEVIEWVGWIGNVQQWGSEPWSTMPRRIAQVTEACALPGAWVAQNEQGDVRAFLALGESMPYVPAPTGPELYVRVLVASRDVRVRGIGRRLMAFADEQARAAGVA